MSLKRQHFINYRRSRRRRRRRRRIKRILHYKKPLPEKKLPEKTLKEKSTKASEKIHIDLSKNKNVQEFNNIKNEDDHGIDEIMQNNEEIVKKSTGADTIDEENKEKNIKEIEQEIQILNKKQIKSEFSENIKIKEKQTEIAQNINIENKTSIKPKKIINYNENYKYYNNEIKRDEPNLMEQSINERNNVINENNENREDVVSMTITSRQIGNYDDEEEEMPETNGEKNRDESFFSSLNSFEDTPALDNEQDEDGLNSEDGNAIGKVETNQKNKKKG